MSHSGQLFGIRERSTRLDHNSQKTLHSNSWETRSPMTWPYDSGVGPFRPP
jgi:hypothetical protein